MVVGIEGFRLPHLNWLMAVLGVKLHPAIHGYPRTNHWPVPATIGRRSPFCAARRQEQNRRNPASPPLILNHDVRIIFFYMLFTTFLYLPDIHIPLPAQPILPWNAGNNAKLFTSNQALKVQ